MRYLAIFLILFSLAGCASTGSNTTGTNVAVTTEEGVATTLVSIWNTEQAALKAGTITPAQDEQFQTLFSATKNAYLLLNSATQTALTATGVTQSNAVAQVTTLTAQFPTLLANLEAFLTSIGVK